MHARSREAVFACYRYWRQQIFESGFLIGRKSLLSLMRTGPMEKVVSDAKSCVYVGGGVLIISTFMILFILVNFHLTRWVFPVVLDKL